MSALELSAAFDRRALLRGGGAFAFAALGGALAPGALGGALQATADRPKLRKACMLYMCADGKTLREKFEILKRAGFEGVELDSPTPIPREEILAARDATGLAVCGVVDSVHWRQSLADADEKVRAQAVAALETALRDCHAFGGESVLLVPAIVNTRVSYEQAYHRSQAELRKVLPLAAELRVKIGIENVWNDFLLSPLEAARYVDELESPWVGWHLDCGNVVTYGHAEQWVRILGKRLVKLHVKDYSRKRRDAEGLWKGFDVALGEGDVDWKAVVTALDEVGFSGWASAEVAAGDEQHLRVVVARMDRLLAR
ncbi:MAG: sugar phosphate isomerase/epimerase [Planctomycetes bacterium]|nr:sugar phosphate isomerase/epimerase [Planctomycetota bacterium]